MANIQQETAEWIWQCYREIHASEHLLQDMKELKEKYPRDEHAQHLKDAFGRRRNLQLGIPSGENAHRLLDVSPKLAESIIISHIAIKQAELIEANERARIEMGEE